MGMFPQERRSTWKNTEHEMETGFVWGLIGIRGLVVGLNVTCVVSRTLKILYIPNNFSYFHSHLTKSP